MNFSLSVRLQYLMELIPKTSELWDIGCDHGLLGLQALAMGRAQRVHFVDPAPAVIEKLKQELRSPGLSVWWRANRDKIFFHQKMGEEVLESINGVAVIAGMGGEKMAKIIEKDFDGQKLVLNPFSHIDEVKTRLVGRSWEVKQSSVRDRDIDYVVYEIKNGAKS